MAIVVPAGEVKEVGGLAEGYRIRITGGPVYLGHNRSEVASGNAVRYPIGVSGTLGNLRGKPVYAFAPDTNATIEVDVDGFSLRDTIQELLGVKDSRNEKRTVYQDQTRRTSERAKFVNADQTTTVSASTTEDTVVTASAGTIAEVLAVEINVPVPGSASSGNHLVVINSESEGVTTMYGESDNTSRVQYARSHWKEANNVSHPPSPGDQTSAARSLWYDDTNGLLLRYQNNLDVDNSNTRTYRLWVREVTVE